MIPAAASAIASGSSRRRLRKTISSVAAITSSAAISSPAIEPVIVLAEIVDDHRHAGHRCRCRRRPSGTSASAIAWRIERDRLRLLRVAERGLEPHLDQGRVLGREQVGEARLGLVHAPGLVEHDLRDELRRVDRRQRR